MSTIYVAPSEPEALRAVADHVSQHPERFGVDVLIVGSHHTVGVQRKTVSDLVASLNDGRLAEQSVLMKGLALDEVVVLVEGSIRFVNDELMLGGWGERLSRKQFKRVLSTLRASNIHVHPSENLADTVHWVEVLNDWAEVEHHSTLAPVSRNVSGDWGEKKRRHYQVQVLMGFPGIGKGLAERIVDALGGLPFVWGRKDELMGVPGVGKKKLSAMEELIEDE